MEEIKTILRVLAILIGIAVIPVALREGVLGGGVLYIIAVIIWFALFDEG